MPLKGTMKCRSQPSAERWADIARAHQGYHSQVLRTKGREHNIDAVNILMQSPVSDHVLDAGWLAVEASALFDKPKGLLLFDLADEAWRSMQDNTTSLTDDLQASHALAFLPLFRDVYRGRRPDLRRLDVRLSQLAQRVLSLEVFAGSNQVIGASDEIATTTFINRASWQQGAITAHAWPTATKNDRGQCKSTNTDVDIGEYPSCNKSVQVKHRRIRGGYAANGTPAVSMTAIFPELKDNPMLLMETLAHTEPDNPLSVEFAQRMRDAVNASITRVGVKD